MAKPNYRWLSSTEQLVDHIRNGGSLHDVTPGEVYQIGDMQTTWDMSKEWDGPMLDRVDIMYSLWAKRYVVSLSATVQGVTVPHFRLEMPADTKKDDTRRAAETYLTILNLRRKTYGEDS